MRRSFCFLAVVIALSAGVVAQEPAWQPAPGHVTLPLWPHEAPGVQPNAGAEADMTTAKDHLIAGKPVIRLGSVSAPTLTVYSPAGKNSGAAVVVFPGGS